MKHSLLLHPMPKISAHVSVTSELGRHVSGVTSFFVPNGSRLCYPSSTPSFLTEWRGCDTQQENHGTFLEIWKILSKRRKKRRKPCKKKCECFGNGLQRPRSCSASRAAFLAHRVVRKFGFWVDLLWSGVVCRHSLGAERERETGRQGACRISAVSLRGSAPWHSAPAKASAVNKPT